MIPLTSVHPRIVSEIAQAGCLQLNEKQTKMIFIRELNMGNLISKDRDGFIIKHEANSQKSRCDF